MRFSFFYIIFFLSFLGGCKLEKPPKADDYLLSIGNRKLKTKDITDKIPKGTSSADSTLLAESYIRVWVKNQLVRELAIGNLSSEMDEIDKMVQEYKDALLRYRYQEQLVKERLKPQISETEILAYYDNHSNEFLLDKCLIKGLFIKVPKGAPHLEELKKWYVSSKPEEIEKIEKYCFKNATIYEYFYDKWVDLDDVMVNIPYKIVNKNRFLNNNKHLEIADSSYCYLLNIDQYFSSGKVAPYEYAAPKVLEILINKQRVDFLRTFEDDLYNEAVKSGKIKYSSHEE